MGDNGQTRSTDPGPVPEETAADDSGAVALFPVAAQVIMGFQDDPPGTHRSVVVQVTIPGSTVLIGMDRDYARAVAHGLLDHADGISSLQVASAAEVEQLRRPR